MTELSQEAQDAIRRVEKLLRLAAKNSNENEAAVLRVRDQASWDEMTAQEAADIRMLEMTHEELS